MNLLCFTHYPISDATKPSQCLGTGMTRNRMTGKRAQGVLLPFSLFGKFFNI
ncbi:hypothetical protein wVul_0525 [Wolbachia endosymbiont of Armadillidium vulgare str. wVulC]|uniref:Uncharacterized protein n=1 Tax=Wolbachia endosymbiont of Armadillidium arcangelii TaxID=3158571 RepID=A0AAU7Q3W3_9RICK|nr:hypothetical protein [Wolbachia endosymbiont of Armadillidium vulgare]KLT23322.1 hypothetical protein wVul_0525 [Wolbachia endosymbiont of Armadillidium vulgare str. wVulC]